ncbi:MAG: YceH family protein [Verrucomicrobia bacterium]|nr:YceH family protein [Verrucomicrobiota bacterium]
MNELKVRFPELQLSAPEARVLGSLLEKEATTPAYYPLTLNSLQAACNQSSNRHPVMQLEESAIDKALVGLRLKGLVVQLQVAGARSLKYKHILPQMLELDAAQSAILTVLLLRGTQTAGELKQRCERMHDFPSLEEVEEALQRLIGHPHGPLAVKHPSGSGRRVETYAHLLGGAPISDGNPAAEAATSIVDLEDEQVWRSRMERKIQDLQASVEELTAMMHHLRSELGAF